MKPLRSAIEQPLQYYRQWDFLIFTVLTLLSVVNGQSTVFYLLYFFWWNELIRLVVDRLCYKHNKNAVYEITRNSRFFESLFLMGIYWVFLVVIFGFIAAADSPDAVIIVNMQVLMFHNWFFNINLIFVLLERWYLHRTQQPLQVYFDAFNPNTIVLHVSIIVGAVLMFFVVRNYPEIFTPQNRWGSALIILPFLLLRGLMQKLTAADNVIQKQNNNKY
ncbi:MAG TPA: hypothetical protein PLE75_08860 [Ferruginibacter sp.]|nr:hypothetical protein [Ferruginibacter sp.]HRO06780.1 hypothetical protein [Ferruginibacter sp.]HRO97110.1 hypothetical protein [Ferruginibacter sp.]HRP50425.1 hypothetical protein [Ferruginibacter sp.]